MSEASRAPSIITPETKLAELLAAHPEIEERLIALSPEFRRLKNPVLRATVAKVATLGQVARIGGLAVGDLINELRRAISGDPPAGESSSVPSGASCAGGGAPLGPSALATDAPAWLDRERVAATFDARPMIEQGSHPLPDVVRAAQSLGEGQVLVLITPFEPAPLVDTLRNLGFEAWGERLEAREVRTYFRRR